MMGAFARMVGSRSRVLSVEDNNAVRSRTEAGYAEHAAAADAPPERFVDKLSDEGGDVYVAPVLDALRAALRARLARSGPPATTGDASTDAPEGATPSPRTEAA